MAGNYPDYPSYRMAWEKDGTQVYLKNPENVLVAVTDPTQLANTNDEDDDTGLSTTSGSQSDSWYTVFIFPELRDIDGWLAIGNLVGDSETPAVEVSADTTNGFDGTWTGIGVWNAAMNLVKPFYRTAITSGTALAVRAIRFLHANNPATFRWKALHIFGEPAPGANPDRLALWDPTLDQRVGPAHFDWGNTPRNSSADKTFRVKNLSATQTAQSVRVAMDALTDASPSVPAQHTLSTDGSTFLAQVNIGDLAPGAISGLITLRRITPSNAQLSLWTFRVYTEALSWV